MALQGNTARLRLRRKRAFTEDQLELVQQLQPPEDNAEPEELSKIDEDNARILFAYLCEPTSERLVALLEGNIDPSIVATRYTRRSYCFPLTRAVQERIVNPSYATLNSTRDSYRFPLTLAVGDGDIDKLRMLLEKGSHLKVFRHEYLKTIPWALEHPLSVAAMLGPRGVDIARLLIEHGITLDFDWNASLFRYNCHPMGHCANARGY